MTEKERADSALMAIPTPGHGQREQWIAACRAYKAADGDFETFDQWSARATDGSYNQAAARAVWQSFTAEGGTTEKTLYKMARDAGWTPPPPADWERRPRRDQRPAPAPQPKPAEAKPEPTEEQRRTVRDYITAAQTHSAEAVKYCEGRGLDAETVKRFGIGYDPATREIVIPYPTSAYYVARQTAITPNDPDKSKGNRYRYPKKAEAGERPLYNIPALNDNAGFVAITEGQIDALTMEQAGAATVATTTPGALLDAISTHGTTARFFVVIPDNDKAGEAEAGAWREALTKAGREVYTHPIPAEYHDANDFLLKAPADFYDWARGAATVRLAEYQQITGAGRIPALLDYITQRPPAISTGYPTLDLVLGDGRGEPGGLMPGLYTIGAISSLGKTTFAMQIADSIAASGRDVLIIALEMSALELMAKSISRLTTEAANRRDWKTTQGVMQGARYTRYSEAEKTTIATATARYKEIAERLYILEGIGTIRAEDVRAAVAKHTEITGAPPIVVIDYLQILAPHDPRQTDKANTDAAVLELKRISRDFDTPILAISSFNRANYRERVSMEALKESGAIEYSSDVVIGLQLEGAGGKDFDIDKAKAADPRKIEAVILKNRNGRTGDIVPFEYEARFNLFRDVKQGHEIDPRDSAALITGHLDKRGSK